MSALALGMMSGGLDSQLAVRLLQQQGVTVLGVSFATPFFGAERARSAARALGIELRVVDLTAPHLALVKDPPHGYGANLNPCIDCHALMFQHTGRLMEELGAAFIFSGEVLGQRPLSQNRGALQVVARASGYAEAILRPLSAKLLPETRMERDGLVDRQRLLDLQGRSRKPQLALAAQWGLTDFPSPAGGCLLTDPGFSARLAELFEHLPAAGPADVERLKVGRHYRLPSGRKVIVGRDAADCQRLAGLARPGDERLQLADQPGPLTVLEGPADEVDRQAAAALTVRHSKAAAQPATAVRLSAADGQERLLHVAAASDAQASAWRVGAAG